uniref:Uncharacterized protein n=1 Tax=Romanomermis culicivorax TaxID=13658 RepID=A0A915IU14_ROMCU
MPFLKNNKASVIDPVSAEMLKNGGQSLLEELRDLINLCWSTARVAENRHKSVTIKLPKEANLANCNNWREIMLNLVAGQSVTPEVKANHGKKAPGSAGWLSLQ